MRKNDDIKHSFIVYAIVVTSLAAIFMFFKTDNIVEWIQAGFTIRKQERQIELLGRQNAELEKRINDLSTNRDTLEKFAREEFFFAAPGDDIYITE